MKTINLISKIIFIIFYYCFIKMFFIGLRLTDSSISAIRFILVTKPVSCESKPALLNLKIEIMDTITAEQLLKILIESDKTVWPVHLIGLPNGKLEEVNPTTYHNYKGPKKIVVTIKTEA